jgi:hypothetical protein
LHFGDSDNGRIGQVAYNNSDDSLLFTANNSERSRITSDGDFLVRQTSADVHDTNTGGSVRQYWGNQFSAQNNTNSRVIIGSASNSGLVGGATVNASSKPIVNSYMAFTSVDQTAGGEDGIIAFYTSSGGGSGTEKMRIASDGTLFHGRTSDFYMSDSMASKNLVLDGGTGANDLTIVSGKLSASTMYHIGFFNANSHVGNISTNGYNTTYTTSSDYRYKENVNYEWRGLEKINDLRPAQFNFINETEIQEGFIAHEAQKVTPYAVVGEKDGETKQTMDYGRITPLLVKAIQEQQKLIETLQAKVEALENG